MKQIEKKYLPWAYLVGVVGLLSATFTSLIAVFTGTTIDGATAKNFSQMWWGIGLQIVFIVLLFGILVIFDYLVNLSMKKIIHELKSSIYHRMTGLTIAKYAEKEQNSYLNLLTQDINLLHDNYLLPKYTIITGICSFIVSVITLLLLSWQLGIAFLIVAGVYLLVSPLFAKRLQKKTTAYSLHNDTFLKVITKFLSGFSTLHLLGTQENYEVKNRAEDERVENSRQQFEFMRGVLGDYAMLLSFLFEVLCTGIGVIFVYNGALSIGVLMAALQLLNGVFYPLQGVANSRNQIRASVDLINNFDQYLTVAAAGDGEVDCPAITSIDYQDVGMAFEEHELYASIDQHFELGKHYVIVGESGSGKSTLIKLLLGYYPKYRGDIQINQQFSTRKISQEQLFKHVGYVARDDFMIDGSIAENILLSRNIDLHQFTSLLELLKINQEFLQREVNDRTSNTISTGEKQRIDIARMMLNDPEVIIFDEPTSNLDPVNTRIIDNMILAIHDKIVIVISHDQSQDYLNQFDDVICIGK